MPAGRRASRQADRTVGTMNTPARNGRIKKKNNSVDQYLEDERLSRKCEALTAPFDSKTHSVFFTSFLFPIYIHIYVYKIIYIPTYQFFLNSSSRTFNFKTREYYQAIYLVDRLQIHYMNT